MSEILVMKEGVMKEGPAMKVVAPSWLDRIIEANACFRGRVNREKLPLERKPSPYAIVTCMDPRINLEGLGILPFTNQGEARSDVRIIRTAGGMIEQRSLLIAIFLAGIREFAIVMHSDCACCLANSKIDTIIDDMRDQLGEERLTKFRAEIGEPFDRGLASWLKVFADPREAVKQEVDFVRSRPFVPETVVVHGIVYGLSSAKIDVVVDGYEQLSKSRRVVGEPDSTA